MYNIDTSDINYKDSEYIIIRIFYEDYEIDEEIELSKRENIEEYLEFINCKIYNLLQDNDDDFYSIHIIRKNE